MLCRKNLYALNLSSSLDFIKIENISNLKCEVYELEQFSCPTTDKFVFSFRFVTFEGSSCTSTSISLWVWKSFFSILRPIEVILARQSSSCENVHYNRVRSSNTIPTLYRTHKVHCTIQTQYLAGAAAAADYFADLMSIDSHFPAVC